MSASDQQPTRMVPVVRDERPVAAVAGERGARTRRTAPAADLPGRSVPQAESPHATMIALVAFYLGMALMIAAPLSFIGIVGEVSMSRMTTYGPLLLLLLAVPLVLIVVPRTRRFGRYLLLGMVSTALVVGVVGGGVLWILVSTS